ncbi:GcrA family cell cycle regulator [Brucella pseudogrignonensis]|uniref:GcrA family cell cycle regulator n=1 Tax=Brucella pseudogrignonensis TaxID=419475 RepID=UPI0038B64544
MTVRWHEGRIPQISQMLKDGFSASEIAERFEGVSRNAVIGLVHRTHELREIGFDRVPGGNPDIAANARKARAKAGPKPAKPQKPKVAKPVIVEPTVVTPETAAVLFDANTMRVELHNLPAGGCKWPVNDVPAGGVFLFCGCKSMAEKPYCEEHYKRSVSKGTPSEQSAIRTALRAA